jgi:hypothetical protein
MADLPIMCTLSPSASAVRKEGLLARIAAQCKQTIQLEAGYRFKFDPNEKTLLLIARMIDAERQCCRFLRFDLSVPPGGGQMSLEVTGPSGTREFLDALFEPE